MARVVLGVVLVAISVLDRFGAVALGETLTAALAVCIILSTGVLSEMGGFVDEGSTLGIRAGGGCLPEGTAKVDIAETTRSIRVRCCKERSGRMNTYSSG